jgi:RNase P/RNase MRP subunit POP5
MKSLKIKPSAKIHRRYLLISGSKKDIENVILDYIGILGWAKAAPTFVMRHDFSGKQVLAIERKSLNDVRASFELTDKKVEILKVSGTLKGLGKDPSSSR